jgi:hypothetical protein
LSAAEPVGGALVEGEFDRGQAYESAVGALMEASLYREGLYVISRFERDPAGPFSFATRTHLACFKAKCLGESDQKAEAIVEYERLLNDIRGKQGFEIEARNCERQLKKLRDVNSPTTR